MTVTLVNGCVLFAHPYVWQTSPAHKRIWQTEIGEALPGGETRQALRAVSRRQLTVLITTCSLAERVRLESRVDAAKKSGFGCAPLHGRCCFLSAGANAGANSITQDGAAWNWQAGDYVILLANDQIYDVAAVVNVAGGVLTLATNLNYNWPAQALCWPVIFGKFTADKEAAINGALGEQKITIAELTSGRSVQIGVTPAQPPGVGQQVIGSTNVIG